MIIAPLAGRLTPFCGAAPAPAALAGRWHFDAVVIAIMALPLAAWLRGALSRLPRWRIACGVAGWLVALATFVSPLCALSVALFSARVGEHMLLTTVGAPLIALGRPVATLRALAWRAPAVRRGQPLAAAGALAAALWFWHAPGPYDASFVSPTAFWVMQATFAVTSLWFWGALFEDAQPADAVLATFFTTGEMGLLGALLTFAGHPLYSQHLSTTRAWGLTPLQDQQLGGAIMWIPAGAIFAGGLVGAFMAAMRRGGARRAPGAA